MASNDINKLMKEAERTKKMNARDAMYSFEHGILNGAFFDPNVPFLGSLISNKDFIYDIYAKYCRASGKLKEYYSKDFSLSAHADDKGRIVFKLIPPAPVRCPLCKKIYLIYNEDGTPAEYKTLELGIDKKSGVLCGWGSNGVHYNYGKDEINGDECGLISYDLNLEAANSFEDLLSQRRIDVTSRVVEEPVVDVIPNPVKKTEEKTPILEKTVVQSSEQKKKCEECGNDVPSDSKFCPYCGSNKIVSPVRIMFCRKCGAKLLPDSKFCNMCGCKII